MTASSNRGAQRRKHQVLRRWVWMGGVVFCVVFWALVLGWLV